MKEEQNIASTFFGAFPSDRMLKATKNVNSHFFIHSNSSCKLHKRIPINYTSEFRELFGATKQFVAKHECFIYKLRKLHLEKP